MAASGQKLSSGRIRLAFGATFFLLTLLVSLLTAGILQNKQVLASVVVCNDGSVHASPTEDYACMGDGEGGIQALYPYAELNPGDTCPEFYGREGQTIPEGEDERWCDMTATSSGSDDDSCESKSGAMGWVMCPVITLVDSILNWIDRQIQALLEINRDMYTDGDLRTAWSNIRNIAYIILIPIMLVMVIGTAMSWDFLDAYTVKRALPRMIVAIIFISLSWEITSFLINLSNVVGGGVLGIMTSPFGIQGGMNLTSLFEFSYGGAVAQYAGIGAFLIALFFIEGIGGIVLLFIGSAALILATALLVLVARQLFVLVLALLAPLAILSWIFPGNDRLWKLWWGAFSKLLIMFPLIMALIASGRIFAFVIGNTPTGDVAQSGLMDPLLKIVAYIIPYALIPFTFKFAGGVFATFTGMVNDRERGLFDRMKNRRQKHYGTVGRNLRSGDLFQGRTIGGRTIGENRLFNRFNRMAKGASMGARARFGLGERGRQAESIETGVLAQEQLKASPQLAQLAMYDDGNAVMAFSGGSRIGAEEAARQMFRKTITVTFRDPETGEERSREEDVYDEERGRRAIEAASSIGFNKANAAAALTTVAQNKSRAIENGRYDIVQDGINRLSEGNAQMAQQLAYGYQYFSRGSGRIDLGGNWMGDKIEGRALEFAQRAATRENRAVTNHDIRTAMSHQVMLDGIARTEATELVRGYPDQMKQVINTIGYMMEYGDDDAYKQAATRILEIQNVIPYASGKNQEIFNDFKRSINIEASRPLDIQLADAINATRAQRGVQERITADELRASARTYDPQRFANDTVGMPGSGGGGQED